MEIRKATKRDLSGIVDLWWEMQSSHDAYDLKFYRTKSEVECRELAKIYFAELLGDENHLVFVAAEGKKSIGMIHIEILAKPPIFHTRRYASIRETAVTQSKRNQGIFKWLLNHAIDELRAQRIGLIELFVDKDNPAVEVYKRLGFTVRQELMIRSI